MVPLARLAFTAITVVSVLTGCGGEPVPPEPGPAARKVTAVRDDENLRVTAEVTGWEVKPHPQVPDRGDTVFFTYRFTPEGPGRLDLQICAIDDHKVVLLCDSITNNGLVDGWIGPALGLGLSRTADVVLLPNQMYPGLHAHDPKRPRRLRPAALSRPRRQALTRFPAGSAVLMRDVPVTWHALPSLRVSQETDRVGRSNVQIGGQGGR